MGDAVHLNRPRRRKHGLVTANDSKDDAKPACGRIWRDSAELRLFTKAGPSAPNAGIGDALTILLPDSFD
jgi:hypothetical protein